MQATAEETVLCWRYGGFTDLNLGMVFVTASQCFRLWPVAASSGDISQLGPKCRKSNQKPGLGKGSAVGRSRPLPQASLSGRRSLGHPTSLILQTKEPRETGVSQSAPVFSSW